MPIMDADETRIAIKEVRHSPLSLFFITLEPGVE